jgi:hypothetical protein
MMLRIGGYELSAFNGLVVELDRWNSLYDTRRTVRLKYYNSGREVEYSYKELAITGAMITSILDSTNKKIHFAQRWKESGDWDWVLVVENSKYRVVYECCDPLTLDRDELRRKKWYKALNPFLGEFATIGLIAWEWDGLVGVEKKSECQEVSHELTQTEAS